MRTEYGKLVYLLQDSTIPEIEQLLGFKMVKPVKTVYGVLKAKGALGVLQDPLLMTATAEISAENKPRYQVQREIKTKEAAQETIARKYCNEHITADEIKTCIYSIADNNAFHTFNRDPVDKMIKFLMTYFKPTVVDEPYTLAIQGGMVPTLHLYSSTLTHSSC